MTINKTEFNFKGTFRSKRKGKDQQYIRVPKNWAEQLQTDSIYLMVFNEHNEKGKLVNIKLCYLKDLNGVDEDSLYNVYEVKLKKSATGYVYTIRIPKHITEKLEEWYAVEFVGLGNCFVIKTLNISF